MRLFAALVPPPEAVEHLAMFLEPRQHAGPDLRWTAPEQWHVTLAFMARVTDRHLDDLLERLERAAARRTACPVRVAGAGAFPDPTLASVLFAGLATDAAGELELGRLATGVRAAAARAGAGPDGGRFHAHLTLARSRRPVEATRWLRVLDPYRGPTWPTEEVTLIASHLGEGPRRRPRYEEVARLPVGAPSAHRPETAG